MREIKFRAWDSTKNNWLNKLTRLSLFYKPNPVYSDISDFKTMTVILNPSTGIELMQFTGLKDTKGVDIYEGDIVEVRDVGFGYKYVGVINWDQESLSYQLGIIKDYPTMGQGLRDIFYTLKYHTFEVIGNIYENGDLLK